MHYQVLRWCGLGLLLWASLCLADIPEIIPASFPADKRPAFARERAALLVERKKLDARIAKHNRVCTVPDPYHAPRCNEDRLTLFQQEDRYQKKVKDFNKRMAAIDNPVDPKPASPALDK